MKIKNILQDIKNTGMTYQEIADALSTDSDKINPSVIFKWHEGVEINQILIDRADRAKQLHKSLQRKKKIKA